MLPVWEGKHSPPLNESKVCVQQNYKFPLNYLLGKNVEETIFTWGRTKGVVEAGTERIVIL